MYNELELTLLFYIFACVSGKDIQYSFEPEAPPKSEPEAIAPNSEPSTDREWVYLSVGETHNCAIDKQQKATCWGYSLSGQTLVPDIAFQSISAGLWQTCGIDMGGELHCWGCEGNDLGQCDAPTGTFIAVSTGPYHSCAINNQGSIECWGCASNNHGQCDPPTGTFVQINSGSDFSCARSEEGSIQCWGCINTIEDSGECIPPEGSFIDFATGAANGCALDANNQVTCWGRDLFSESTPPAQEFSAIALGHIHGCGLDTEGIPTCWGCARGPEAQLGQCESVVGIYQKIGAGTGHTCALNHDEIICWGCGDGSWMFDLGQCESPQFPR